MMVINNFGIFVWIEDNKFNVFFYYSEQLVALVEYKILGDWWNYSSSLQLGTFMILNNLGTFIWIGENEYSVFSPRSNCLPWKVNIKYLDIGCGVLLVLD